MTNDVSTVRLYALRAMYALVAFGLGSVMWPRVLYHGHYTLMQGVGFSLFAALSALMAVGIRYPLQMLPIMLFELLWKTIWLLSIALPLYLAHQMDPESIQTTKECLPAIVLIPLVMPWRYFWANYVKKPGDRWRAVATKASGPVL